MSIIETLTEGIVNRDMKKEGRALLNKWSKTGLLEGLQSEHQKASMARLLENQAKELLREANTMEGGSVEGFAAVAFPIVRRVFAGLIANDLVSVQPMSLPSGLIFFLDFTFERNRLGQTAGESIYGTDRVGSQITGGVNLVGTSLREDLSGPRLSGRGYAYASATGSFEIAAANTAVALINVSASMSDANRKKLSYDPDIMALADGETDGTHTQNIFELEIKSAGLAAEPQIDLDNLAAFDFTGTNGVDQNSGVSGASALRRLSRLANTAAGETAGSAFFYFIGTSGSAVQDSIGSATDITGSVPFDDNLTSGGALGSVEGTTLWPLEAETAIPEIDIKVDSIAITAQTKKLKAKWTPELGQDLNAYHNLDAEVELTSILSEQIALELDREILADLVNGAKAAVYYWSRSPGLFVNRETGAEIGASAAAPDFTGTVSEWYETLIETINDVSAQIHRKTLRGGANFVIVSPEVANILEFTSGFRANVTADADKGDIGAVKVGSLSRKFDVIVDPYFPRNVVLVGRKGSSFLESGYVYAPYVPLQTTPTIFGPEDFVPRKGVMTRYAKKMVRPDMYGLVICRGLLGESGSGS
jgi:hypothetical protein